MKRTLAISIAAAALLLPLTACTTERLKEPTAAAEETATDAEEAATEEEEPEPEPEPVIDSPKAKDFSVELKVKSKQCFGTAGCNLELDPKLTWKGALPLDDSKTYDITYEVSGDESGPITETLTLTNGKDYETFGVSMSTTSSGVVPKATVKSVEKADYGF